MKTWAHYALYFFFFITTCFPAAAAAPYRIYGTVIDKITEQPLLDADLRLIDAATDSTVVTQKSMSSWYDGVKVQKSPRFEIE